MFSLIQKGEVVVQVFVLIPHLYTDFGNYALGPW